jgi:hypothetical protein
MNGREKEGTQVVCDFCENPGQDVTRGICEKCRAHRQRSIFGVAEDLLMVMDFESMDSAHQNEIDSHFYFRAFCDRWIDGVNDLRLRFFEREEPPEPADDTPDEIFHLPTPFRSNEAPALRHLDRIAGRFDADLRLTQPQYDEFTKLLVAGDLGIKPEDVVRWWRVRRLGEPYGLSPEIVWEHLLTGEPVRMPYITYRLAGNPPVLTVLVWDPAALDYRALGLRDDDLIVRNFWKPLQDRERHRPLKASQKAGHLIRTWTTFSLQSRCLMSVKTCVDTWNDRIGDRHGEDLSWKAAKGDDTFRQSARILKERLRRWFRGSRLQPGYVMVARPRRGG